MKKEQLIQKWLDGELTAEELKVFQQLEEYDDYKKIADYASYFKAPAFDQSSNYKAIQSQLEKSKTAWYKPLLKIAAVLLIGFATYFAFFTQTELQDVNALAGTTTNVELPDHSMVKLNAGSHLSYQAKKWEDNRLVKLEGEAYFEVAKGKKFKVQTNDGTVSVLGTHFNVKQRNGYFEVKCFEGLVRVDTKNNTILLPAGNSYRLVEGTSEKAITTATEPSWVNGVSSFKSVPFHEVVEELERQYNIDIKLKKLTFDTDELFTGSFVNNDLKTAMQAITIPFNLTYHINENGHDVTLKESE